MLHYISVLDLNNVLSKNNQYQITLLFIEQYSTRNQVIIFGLEVN